MKSFPSPAPNQAAAALAPLAPDFSAAPAYRVIVADDDPVSREILSGLLSKWRYHVLLAEDGHEAMEMLRAQKEPVLAVLDWMMPGLEGRGNLSSRSPDQQIGLHHFAHRADQQRTHR